MGILSGLVKFKMLKKGIELIKGRKTKSNTIPIRKVR